MTPRMAQGVTPKTQSPVTVFAKEGSISIKILQVFKWAICTAIAMSTVLKFLCLTGAQIMMVFRARQMYQDGKIVDKLTTS